MPNNYNGNDAAVTARAAVQISVPADADPQNAAAYNPALQELADIADHLETKAGLLDVSSSWTATQNFAANGTSQPAATFVGSAPNGSGATFAGLGIGNALQAGEGHIKLVGTNPAKNAPYVNTVAPTNICKAWACIVCNAGAYTYEGFNVSSVVSSGTDGLKVTLAQGVAATTSAAVLAIMAAGTVFISSGFTSTTEIAVTAWKYDGTAHDLQTGSHRLHLAVFGYQ